MELLIAMGVLAAMVVVIWILIGYPLWNVWASKQHGEAELQQARNEQKIQIAEAQSRLDAAELNKKAAVVEAQAVAEQIDHADHAQAPGDQETGYQCTGACAPRGPREAGQHGSGEGLMVSLEHYLTLSALLFAISVAGIFLNRKNVIVILMSIELVLLSVNINFVAFSSYLGDLVGQVFTMFVLTVAAAEAEVLRGKQQQLEVELATVRTGREQLASKSDRLQVERDQALSQAEGAKRKVEAIIQRLASLGTTESSSSAE